MEIEYELGIFAVAIAFCRHVATSMNINKQFSPLELADEVNSLPYGAKVDFNVDPEALAHGINRFQKGIRKLEIGSLIVMNSPQNEVAMIPAYYNLAKIQKALDVKFNCITDSSLEIPDEVSMLKVVVDMRNKILKAMGLSSAYQCASSVFGQLIFQFQKKKYQSRPVLLITI